MSQAPVVQSRGMESDSLHVESIMIFIPTGRWDYLVLKCEMSRESIISLAVYTLAH